MILNKKVILMFAKENNIAFMETSAFRSINVDLAFQNLIAGNYYFHN